MTEIGNSIASTLVDTVNRIILFIPQFVSGLVLLVIGWVLAQIAQYVVRRIIDLLRIDQFLASRGMEERPSARVWSGLASQVVFWFVFLAFLIPAFNAWQLPNVTGLLNQILLYLPKVFVALVIGFIGYLLANFIYNIVKNASRGVGKGVADLFGRVAQYALYVFTALVVLNQLEIASNLIQLLFGGVIAMVALAGGLAFGLGGQDVARQMLSRFSSPGAVRRISEQISRQPIYASEIRSRKKRIGKGKQEGSSSQRSKNVKSFSRF